MAQCVHQSVVCVEAKTSKTWQGASGNLGLGRIRAYCGIKKAQTLRGRLGFGLLDTADEVHQRLNLALSCGLLLLAQTRKD